MTQKNLLFSPLAIGSMQLKNRIVMSPMTTAYGNADETPSDKLTRYYVERAKGGVGLITMEVCTVHPEHRYQTTSLGLWDDKFIEPHRALVDKIHAAGAKVQPQISHPGPESLSPFFAKKPALGPSVYRAETTGQVCRELAVDEIREIVGLYGDAARRARDAGYDGIELHAAHCYMLIASFLSPYRNKRRDEYSGSTFDGRTKLLLEVIDDIVSKVGPDFPITVRLAGYERIAGGRDIADTQRLAPLLVQRGVAALHISGGINDALSTQLIAGNEFPDAMNRNLAAAIKRVVSVPVMVVGRIHDPVLAEEILVSGDADVIVMGRPLLADPELPEKARTGRYEEIRRCISCENCIDSMLANESMSCAVNAACGNEVQYDFAPAAKKKHVVVIGGGPGGMEAARVAALRGHRVTLLEKLPRLGGSLTLASTVHSDNQRFLDYLLWQVKNLSIDVRLGTVASAEYVQALAPDAVIVATGAQLATPEIPGGDLPHVFTGALLRSLLAGNVVPEAADKFPPGLYRLMKQFMPVISRYLSPTILRFFTKLWMPVGPRVVIIGADLAATELAEFFAKRKRTVTLIEPHAVIAREVGNKRRREHMMRMDALGVTVLTGVSVNHIRHAGVMLQVAGSERMLECDTVIVAGEPVADLRLHALLQHVAPEVHAIGDCTGLGLIRKATADAMRVAHSL